MEEVAFELDLKAGKDCSRSGLDCGCLLLVEELSQVKTLSTDTGWCVHLIASPVWAGVELIEGCSGCCNCNSI